MAIGGSRIKELMNTDKYHHGGENRMQNKSISPKQGEVNKPPNLLKTVMIKSMKRVIKAMKTANDEPMTMIKIAKSMMLKMEAKTYFKMKMIMTTKVIKMEAKAYLKIKKEVKHKTKIYKNVIEKLLGFNSRVSK
jgi:hypothetical protein